MKTVNVYTSDSHTKIVITEGDFSNEIFMSHQFVPASLAASFATAILNLPYALGSEDKRQ